MNERDVAIATSDIMSLVLKIIEYEAHGTGEGDEYIPPSDEAQTMLNELNDKIEYWLRDKD